MQAAASCKAQSGTHLSWRPRSERRIRPRASRSRRRTWWGAGCRWRWSETVRSSRRTFPAWARARRRRCKPPRSRTCEEERRDTDLGSCHRQTGRSLKELTIDFYINSSRRIIGLCGLFVPFCSVFFRGLLLNARSCWTNTLVRICRVWAWTIRPNNHQKSSLIILWLAGMRF